MLRRNIDLAVRVVLEIYEFFKKRKKNKEA